MWQKVAKFKGAEKFRKALYIKVPDARPSKVDLASWCWGDDLVLVTAMPNGDMRAKSRRQPTTAACRSLPWASFRA